MCVRCKELVCPCTPVLGISVKANDDPPPITSHTYIWHDTLSEHRDTGKKCDTPSKHRDTGNKKRGMHSQHMR